MGTTNYDLIGYEPALTAENVAKWQIQKYPPTVDLREMLKARDLVAEVQPFRRVDFRERPNWHAFEPKA